MNIEEFNQISYDGFYSCYTCVGTTKYKCRVTISKLEKNPADQKIGKKIDIVLLPYNNQMYIFSPHILVLTHTTPLYLSLEARLRWAIIVPVSH